jgi:biotin carboxyl carrier protein
MAEQSSVGPHQDDRRQDDRRPAIQPSFDPWAGGGPAPAGRAASPRPTRRRTTAAAGGSLTAPMPATVVKIHVKPGDAVKKGETVLLLEAMKMELPIRAPGDGVVAAVRCREGDLVQADATLIEFVKQA